MLIRITRGVYGYIGPSGYIIAKDKNSAPFELEDQKAERLLNLNVAEVVAVKNQEEKPAPSSSVEKKTPGRKRKVAE